MFYLKLLYFTIVLGWSINAASIVFCNTDILGDFLFYELSYRVAPYRGSYSFPDATIVPYRLFSDFEIQTCIQKNNDTLFCGSEVFQWICNDKNWITQVECHFAIGSVLLFDFVNEFKNNEFKNDKESVKHYDLFCKKINKKPVIIKISFVRDDIVIIIKEETICVD